VISSGQLLADRYRLDTRIAVGGMGEVWRASDTRLDRTVAVKILKAELSGDAEFLHRFRTEARTTASLNHPGIAAVHDYGEASSGVPTAEPGKNDLAYLVMELVSGEPLAGILAREGRMKPERLLPILEQAGRALNAAHERGLVHRDVKPGNILVVRGADGSESVKLTDFGIAKAADAAPVTRNGMVMGTAHYIAPEQATGAEASPSSDVYSLAVCGYECLAGHRPFLSENAVTVAMMHIRDAPPPLPPDVPPTVRALIESTLVKDPAQRYANGGEFADAVALVRAGHPPPAPVGVTHTPPHGLAAQPTVVAAPVGPGSHPTMMPVGPPPGTGAFPPQQPQRNRSVWLWVALAVIGVTLVVMAAVLLPMMLSERNDENSGPEGSTPATSQPGQPGQQPPAQQPSVPEEQPPAQPPAQEQPPESTQPSSPAEQPTTEELPTTVEQPTERESDGRGANPASDNERQPGEGW
jgi:tRNA A-37 threonylcarbamoyl transferase component Bud32